MTTSDVFAMVTMVTLVALFIAFSYWFFCQVRRGRIDPRSDPVWGPYSAPASPQPLLDRDTLLGQRPDYDDDHTWHAPDQ